MLKRFSAKGELYLKLTTPPRASHELPVFHHGKDLFTGVDVTSGGEIV
jgi:hypothetical protein